MKNNIWYNKDKSIMVDLSKIESFDYSPRRKDRFNYWFTTCLSINWDAIILWESEAEEVWELLKKRLVN